MEIDKKKVYTIGDYTFTNYICLSDNLIRQVLEWRNHEEVRRWMYNSDFIPYESHIKYILSLCTREDAYYWLVSYQGEPVGAVSLTSTDIVESTGELGYYMRPDYINTGDGLPFVYQMFAFAIDCLHINSLYGAVNENNRMAYLIDCFIGCETIGMKEKNGYRYYELNLSPDMFHANREDKQNVIKFAKFIKANK